ncbi:MAG: glycoside hydrolase family 130 protein [Phycisphaeraceae bacterium]
MKTATKVTVTRRPERFVSDDRRVITRFFRVDGEQRVRSIVQRVLALEAQEVDQLLEQVRRDFGPRHRQLDDIFQQHFEQVRPHVPNAKRLSAKRRLLIGAYFTMEYSIESAALFNPSIVLHPDQVGLEDDEARFLMSLRATGEGHISSIVFRTGVVDGEGHIRFDPASRFTARMSVQEDRLYEKTLFARKLSEMAALNDTARRILDELPEQFTAQQLDHTIAETEPTAGGRAATTNAEPSNAAAIAAFSETTDNMRWLARSNYHLELPLDTDPSEIVIFPASENESNGIEDVRLTRFVDDDGSVTYFGTYTAYNGFRILPQLLETQNFSHIAIHTLNGDCAQNKGMALFPRKINGLYHMISRLDGENMYLMRSDNVHFWNDAQLLQYPRYAWELVQIGNCGPPIETEAGWILLTHGVGPMRQYCIGVVLLDRDDPSKVIGDLDEPLLVPEEGERDGYVPNVVYSCGALLHQSHLIIPYAVSDRITTFASLDVNELIDALLARGGHAPEITSATRQSAAG